MAASALRAESTLSPTLAFNGIKQLKGIRKIHHMV